MGYDLWTSPVTGYRRRGTRLSELRALIDSGITARAILEPLQSCSLEADAMDAAESLRKREFDFAGVKKNKTGPVLGWVTTDSLTHNRVSDHLQQFDSTHLVSDATPLPSVMKVLRERTHTFVLIGAEVAGIITKADLNKPAVRVYLFTLISLLEMHLGYWIRATYPEDSWQTKLSRQRLNAAKKVQEDRRRLRQNPYLVDCLQFCDKRDLFLSNEALMAQFKLNSKSEAEDFFKASEKLRNDLAHSQDNLVDGSSWEKVIQMIEEIEQILHLSDQKAEQRSLTSSSDQEKELW